MTLPASDSTKATEDGVTRHNTEKFSVQRINREGKKDTEQMVAQELPVTIILNGQELVTMLSSPENLAGC